MVHAGAGPCSQYVLAAEKALRAVLPPAHPVANAEYLRFVQCMRTNGVPNYPLPEGNRTSFKNSGVDPNSPQVQKVNKLRGKKLHLPGWYTAGNGLPATVDWTGAGYPPGNSPACFYKPLSQGGCSGNKTFGTTSRSAAGG